MKTIGFVRLYTNDGEPRVEKSTGEELHTISLITLLLDNCKFKNRADQRVGDKIYQKVKGITISQGLVNIELEDAEFDIVFKYASTFEPFLTGRAFEPFFKELEKSENP